MQINFAKRGQWAESFGSGMVNLTDSCVKAAFGKYHKLRPAETLFDWLEKEGINVPEQDRYYKFFSVFDFEAVLEKREENVKGRNIKSRHVPASFSLCSNIPDHTKAIHEVSDGDSQELVDKMVLHQLTHQRAASRIMREKFKYVIDQFQREMYDIENENPELSKKKFFDKDHPVCKRHNKLKSLHASLLKYCDQLPILGFNSQKYDIPLIRRFLPSSLARLDTIPDFVIKKTNSYMAVSTKKLKYLDLTNYLAAGTSLDSFYRAYNVATPKGTFPYEWFDSIEKLDYKGLPPQTQFYSSLSKQGIDAYTYMSCWGVWHMHDMKTFADYVRYYNDHDVIGMIEGIEKLLAIENEQGLDVFKESVSLATLTQKYLQRNLDENDYFCGISEEHKHIHKDLKTLGIVGGPSIIFHRYHEANVTKIKGKHLCKKVIGFDANALYLSCTGKEMCTGYYSLREKKNEYRRETNSVRKVFNGLNILELSIISISAMPSIRHTEKNESGITVLMDFVSLRTLYMNIMVVIIMVIVVKIKIQRSGKELKSEKKSCRI